MTAKMIDFSITLNGEKTESQCLPPHWRLIDFLHETMGLTGTKYGCGGGMCKACTVAMVDHHGVNHAIPACSTSLESCNDWQIKTVEGLADGENLHPLQSAFIEDSVYQCGYCAPGFLMEAYCLLENRKQGFGLAASPEEAVKHSLESHLCRCTGYVRYLKTVTDVIGEAHSWRPVKKSYNKWELIRWLHEAAEVENALMLQYLYAAFSVKRPRYKALAGHGHRTPGQSHSLLAVAIEEMIHLDTVNRLLVELGATPNLVRQDLPYEPKIYPFELVLEPLSRKSLAKYILAEAPAEFERSEPALFKELEHTSESHRPINDVGSVYSKIREKLQEFGEATAWPRWRYWDKKLKNIQNEGETEHYKFFLDVYKGEHFAFRGISDAWANPGTDCYPAWQIEHRTMWQGRPNSLHEGDGLEVTKLSNFHYWLTMAILELSYRNKGQYHGLARRHMAGPLMQLCWYLPERFGILPPFDKSTMSFYSGSNEFEQYGYIFSLLDKIEAKEIECQHVLPPAYLKASWETRQELLAMRAAL